LLEKIEKGEESEEVLLDDEIFLHMLSAVKYDIQNCPKIPHFIRESSICKKYFQQVNPLFIYEFGAGELSKKDVYKRYLGIGN